MNRPSPQLQSQLALELPSGARAGEFLRALVELSKPRVTRMVVFTAGLGAVMVPGPVRYLPLAVALLGTSLIVAGANALNMYLEAGSDALMERTRKRPIPSGRISGEVALGFSLTLAVLGYAILARWSSVSACLLAVAAFLLYAFAYTPAKRVSPYALHLGAIPGAIPPLIGWASLQPSLGTGALCLFSILFVWQLPHFMAIALFRSADYQRAGIKVYPWVKGVAATERAMLHWSVALALTGMLPWALGLAGAGFGLAAGVLGLSFCLWVALGRRYLEVVPWARSVFIASIPYLLLVLGVLAVGAG